MTKPWDQLEHESSRAFAAFIAYRDLGLRRSCSAIAQQLAMNRSAIVELSKRHNWQNRVKSWDAHLDQITQNDQIEAVRSMKKRQIVLALMAQKVAEDSLKIIIKKFKQDHKNQTYFPKLDSISKLLDTGCRLERLNRDEPEQNLELSQNNKFDNLTLEECENLRSLLTKAGVTL